MPPLSDLVQSGGNVWLFFFSALVLGALHGLEPGHSKTVMTAFIIAIRGTILQAVLLGLSAAVSHSLIVWILAVAGLMYGSHWNTETTEPYFELGSAILIILISLWMLYRVYRDRRPVHSHTDHADHEHTYATALVEGHHHTEGHHHHDHAEDHHHHHEGLDVEDAGFQDAHQRAHAEEIRRRFTDRTVTTWQVVLFGLTGGLIPCAAAITVLLLCLQSKRLLLGIFLVTGFSLGLAATLVASGVLAAWGIQHASRRFKGMDAFFQKAPYLASLFTLLLGLYFGLLAYLHLHG